MALITCPECGHRISSSARLCPKCSHPPRSQQQIPQPPGAFARKDGEQTSDGTVIGGTATGEELRQTVFAASPDELLLLEGPAFLVRGPFSVDACHARLTSKRLVLCDPSGKDVRLQTATGSITSLTELRRPFFRSAVITTAAGETIRLKFSRHSEWFELIENHRAAVDHWLAQCRLHPPETAGSMEWHYVSYGTDIGPVPERDIIRLIQRNHTVCRDTLVWNPYLPEWKRADETVLSFYFPDPLPAGTAEGSVRRSRFFSAAADCLRRYL